MFSKRKEWMVNHLGSTGVTLGVVAGFASLVYAIYASGSVERSMNAMARMPENISRAVDISSKLETQLVETEERILLVEEYAALVCAPDYSDSVSSYEQTITKLSELERSKMFKVRGVAFSLWLAGFGMVLYGKKLESKQNM